MATRKPLFLTEYGGEEMHPTDDIQLGALAMSGDITMGGNEVTGLPAVPSATASASKEYVDAVARDARPKASVRAATTGALPSYTAVGSGVGKTLVATVNGAWNSANSDGVSLVLNDRLLVKNEALAHVDHGIYALTQVGDGSNPWILTRTVDCDEDSEVKAGIYTWVSEGAVLDNTSWTVVTDNPITVDTTAIQWTQTQGPGVHKRLAEELTAEENLSQGDPIEWGTTNDQLRQCRASVLARSDCIGVVENAGGILAGNSGTVVRRGVAVGVLSGATVGQRFFAGSSGGLVQGIGSIAAGESIIFVGTAKNSTDLEVNSYYVGKRAV